MTTYRESAPTSQKRACRGPRCFEAAVGAAIDGATVLTANTRSARTIQSAAEARLRLERAAWRSPDILPYGAFMTRLYSDAVIAGLSGLRALEHEQEVQLWRQIIARSASGRDLLLTDAAASLAAESFRIACEYEIALDSAQMSASSDTRAFSGWAAEFRHQLDAKGFSCPALFARELAGRLSSLKLPRHVFAYLTELTPAQRSFLSALAMAGVEVTIASDDASEGASDGGLNDVAEFTADSRRTIVRYEFEGEADELRGVALWARRQVEVDPSARIGVVVFDLDRKAAQVESAFREVLHPEHLLGESGAEAFEIAAPKPLADYPVVACALGLLSLIAAPVDFEQFETTLRSPYIGVAADVVARFLAGTRKHARRQVSFDDLAGWLTDSASEPWRDAPELRAALERLPKHAAFSGKQASSQQPVAYWANVARELLLAFGWPGRLELTSEEFQCTRSWSELFASVASLEVLDWRCDFAGFVQRLQRAAAARRFKPETLGAPLQIMDLAECEGSAFDALWIAGCSDERWPDSPRISPLLPISLLQAAGAPVPGSAKADERVAGITRRLLQSAPQVSLSLALRSDDEREQRWSPLFAGEESPRKSVGGTPSLAERFSSVAMEAIADDMAPPLAEGEITGGGASLLQEQSNCPFQAFAVRRLLAREEDSPKEAIAPTERGRVIERALQLIWEQLEYSDELRRPDRADVVAKAVDEAMSEHLTLAADAWSLRFRLLERQRTIAVVEEWLELEARRKPFRVLGHQLAVDLELGGLKLHGRVDRLDEVNDAHIVIDYKTGVPDSVNSWRVPRPRRPQLPFYALAMLQRKRDVAGLSFASVRPGECGLIGFHREQDLLGLAKCGKDNIDGTGLDEYTAMWADELDQIAAAFMRGHAAVDPILPFEKSNSPCRQCHLSSLCRVNDVGGDEFDGQFSEACDE